MAKTIEQLLALPKLAFYGEEGRWMLKCECGGNVSLCAYCVQQGLPSPEVMSQEGRKEANLRFYYKRRYGKAKAAEIVSTLRKHPSKAPRIR